MVFYLDIDVFVCFSISNVLGCVVGECLSFQTVCNFFFLKIPALGCFASITSCLTLP